MHAVAVTPSIDADADFMPESGDIAWNTAGLTIRCANSSTAGSTTASSASRNGTGGNSALNRMLTECDAGRVDPLAGCGPILSLSRDATSRAMMCSVIGKFAKTLPPLHEAATW